MSNIPDISLDAQSMAAQPMNEPRPFYWSVRRELWENRSIVIAPLVIAGVILFGFFISLFSLPKRTLTALALPPMQQRAMIVHPFGIAAGLLVFVGVFVGLFYCLDAMYGERRDRSILFWKSLPVSDRVTVLAKATVPLAVIPVISFVLALAVQLVMLIFSTLVLAGSGISPAPLLTQIHLVQEAIVMAYGIIAVTLWYAPAYAWILLVSGWAKRAVILWVVLPFIVLAALGGPFARDFIRYRAIGVYLEAFNLPPHGQEPLSPITVMTPLRFFSTGGVWGGLAVAALLIVLTIRMRRDREPI